MPKSTESLLKSLGVSREEGSDNMFERSFSLTQTKSLSDISEEEYKTLVSANNLLDDGSFLPEEDRQKYLDGLSENDKMKVLWRDRILTIRGSDETPDRHGDIVTVDGWKTGDFQKNPVFLSQHKSWNNPIGRVVKVWKELNDTGAPGNKSLMFRVFFPTKDVSEEADNTFKMYKSGMMNSVSVGFRALKARIPQDLEREALGMKDFGVIFLEQELYELSAVSIPANSNANQVKSLEKDPETVETLSILKSKLEQLEKEVSYLKELSTFTDTGTTEQQPAPTEAKGLVGLLHSHIKGDC